VIPAHIEHVFKALDRIERREPQQPMPVYPALVEGSSPTAGIGTADAGLPIVRYWTVRYRYEGSRLWNYTHVIACDPFKASMVVSKRDRTVVEVVREIRSDEYEALTRSLP
jgi:hypothetical protein